MFSNLVRGITSKFISQMVFQNKYFIKNPQNVFVRICDYSICLRKKDASRRPVAHQSIRHFHRHNEMKFHFNWIIPAKSMDCIVVYY